MSDLKLKKKNDALKSFDITVLFDQIVYTKYYNSTE